jgi:hypothetical protein
MKMIMLNLFDRQVLRQITFRENCRDGFLGEKEKYGLAK